MLVGHIHGCALLALQILGHVGIIFKGRHRITHIDFSFKTWFAIVAHLYFDELLTACPHTRRHFAQKPSTFDATQIAPSRKSHHRMADGVTRVLLVGGRQGGERLACRWVKCRPRLAVPISECTVDEQTLGAGKEGVGHV